MDLNDINLEAQSNDGADVQLEHPVTGKSLEHDGKPMTIRVAGTDSAAYRNKQRELQNRRLQKIAKGRKPDFSNSDAEACELLAACTLGWSGIVVGGDDIAFSQKAAEELYGKHVWIREQVDLFIGDRANFFTTA